VLAAFAFAVSFFVISMSCHYRYLYVLDPSAVLALFLLTLDAKNLLEASQ